MASSKNRVGTKRKKPFSQSLVAGGTAGFVESSICHPLDTVKTRMQLRNNHIESVGTRLKHSLVEPAVMHVRHSLVEPALRFKHSLSEPSTLAGTTASKSKHSLVEPANLIKLRKHSLYDTLSAQSDGIDTNISSTGAKKATNAPTSQTSCNKEIVLKLEKTGAQKDGTLSSQLVSREKGCNAAKCWWNQPKQNHTKTPDTKTLNRPFETRKTISNKSQLRYLPNSCSKPSNKKAVPWWNWHGNSFITLTNRRQSSKSPAWQQSNSSNSKASSNQQVYRRFVTLVKRSSAETRRKVSVGPIQTARKIIRKEGFWSLYKGLSAVYVGIIPKMAIRFVSFEQYKDVIRRYTSLGDKSTNFMAGLSSGLTEAVLIVTPAEVCKIRMQSQRHSLLDPVEANTRKYGNFVQTATTIVREEGYNALYKGLLPTMLRQGCNQAVNFTAYNAMKTHWLERERQKDLQHLGFRGCDDKIAETSQELPGIVSMLIGGLSGAMGPLVNNPLDVVKTRLQKQKTLMNARSAPKYSGIIQSCFKIAKEEGAGALWKGITPRLMRIVPGQAITFTTYEAICRRL